MHLLPQLKCAKVRLIPPGTAKEWRSTSPSPASLDLDHLGRRSRRAGGCTRAPPRAVLKSITRIPASGGRVDPMADRVLTYLLDSN
jgi:hypothetical protein